MLKFFLFIRQGDGKWQARSLDAFPPEIQDGQLLWVDVASPVHSDIIELRRFFSLNERDIQEIILELDERGFRSRIDVRNDLVLCLFKYPIAKDFLEQGKMERIAVLLSPRWLITVHTGIPDLAIEVYKKTSGTYFSLFSPSTDVLLHGLLDIVIKQYYSISESLFEKIETLSQVALSFFKKTSKLIDRTYMMEILQLRRRLIMLKQNLNPVSDILDKIMNEKYSFIRTEYLPWFENLEGKVTQLKDDFDATTEEVSNLSEALINFQTINTNNIVRTLTLISAIFLPLALIAGLYGTNFIPNTIPDLDNPYGFFIMIAVMVIVALGLVAVFKRKGWI